MVVGVRMPATKVRQTHYLLHDAVDLGTEGRGWVRGECVRVLMGAARSGSTDATHRILLQFDPVTHFVR